MVGGRERRVKLFVAEQPNKLWILRRPAQELAREALTRPDEYQWDADARIGTAAFGILRNSKDS